MDKSLRQKAITGVAWTAFNKFGTMIISFVSNIILARLLMPDDFGTIGIMMVFVSFANIFVDGGFSMSLIQKKEANQNDFSSVFYLNLLMSVLLYILLFVSAPIIDSFFSGKAITSMLRVIGLILIFNAFSIIQISRLSISLKFREITVYNLIATSVGVIVAIVMALDNYGVWSLVYKTIITGLILSLILWIRSGWRPARQFSIKSVKGLYRFGGFMFLSTFVEVLYAEIQPIIIGKFFSLGQLGYYTQARKIQEIPANGMVSVINTVAFPIYSKLQDQKEKLAQGIRKSLMAMSYVIIPLMILLIILAKPVVLFLLGDKWEEAYPLLQILSIAGIFRIASGNNMNAIQSIGKGKAFFYIQLAKRGVGLFCIIIGSFFGIMGLMWGFALASFLFWAIDSSFCGKYIGYSFIEQLKNLFPIILLSTLVGVAVYFLGTYVGGGNLFKILFQGVVYATIYISTSLTLKMEGAMLYMDIYYKRKKRHI
mgnify:FL=1|jgi:O-antigen/teichoic acid export membrane protein